MVDFTNLNTQRASVLAALQQLQASVDAQTHDEVTLDAAVADAQAARDVTLGYKGDVTALRDQAGDHADRAEAAWSDVASAIVYQDLAAIAEARAITMVDGCVDASFIPLSLQFGRQWYHEALGTAARGLRRDLPAVRPIIAEASKVTVLDGDDPAQPMWKVFDLTGKTITSVAAKNGKILVGTTAGLVVLDLLAATISMAIAYSATTTPAIVNNAVNDVAMTVLPDAPIDPATGLPVPTIAVATAGGVSEIKHDGTVVDITYSSYSISGFVAFSKANSLMFTLGNSITPQNFLHIYHTIPSVDVNNADAGFKAGASDEYYSVETGFTSGYTGLDARIPFSGVSSADITDFVDGAVGNLRGLAYVSRVPSAPAATSFAAITSTYNTGWMVGDIKGAFLSSTDATSLVGGDIAVNGAFDTDTVWSKQAGWTISSGVAAVNSSVAGSTFIRQGTTVAGEQYRVTFDVTSHTSGQLKAAAGTAVSVEYASGVGSYSFNVVANGSGGVGVYAVGSGVVASVDNVTIEKLDEDRSVNNKGLIVNGTITRSPVATGAELVAYSGFSSSNYLEQPYNPALDFGTGDFCVMGWVKHGTSATQCVAMRQDPSAPSGFGSGASYRFQLYAGNVAMSLPTSSLILSYPTANVGWVFLTWLRRNGVLSIYANGRLLGSSANTDNLTNTSAITRVGILEYNGVLTDAFLGSLALLRISATAPTAEQIKKIYEDEKVLFQENAAATLYGTSDAVTALAHDSDTGLLHVGTSAGRSDFRGLRRVSNTTTPVTTAIAASGGLILEQ